MHSYAFLVSLINRLIPVGIVLYRFVYTCKADWVHSSHQRRRFHFLLVGVMFSFSVILTFFSYYYRNNSYIYLKCMNRVEEFYEKVEGSNMRVYWSLPLYHPFHLLSIVVFYLYIVIVPTGYFLIYLFRRKMDSKLMQLGLNKNKRNMRKAQNLVTTQFNLLIWFCEVVSGCVVLFPGSNIFLILYFFLPSTISPVLYFVGIESNRMAMRNRVMEMLEERRKHKQKQQPEPYCHK